MSDVVSTLRVPKPGQTVLVTGGAGFIGSNFLQLFVPKHPEVRFVNADALTYAGNPLSLREIAESANYSFRKVDLSEEAEVEALFEAEKPDWVFHFAAETHVDRSIKGPRNFLKSNVVATFNLLEAARNLWQEADGHVFHHVSTDEVYGSLGDDGFFREDTPYDPSSPYSASKAGSDHYVRAYHRTFGLPVVVTNCSNNYGPRQFPEKLIPLMILNALDRKPLPIYGAGQNVRDWLYVDDHAEAIWTVATTGKLGETYNIGGNSERKNIDVVDALCEAVAKETQTPVEELTSLITYVADRPGHDHRYAIDTEKIHRELGWQPKESFETGLRKTVRWYLENSEWVESTRTGAYRTWIESNYAAR